MKVLRAHTHYQQPGGEDAVFADECALLEAHGHQVLRYASSNDALDEMGRVEAALRTTWNASVYRELSELVRRERPDVAHFDNTFPLLSPAAYWALRRAGVPVVQTVHNYRLFCSNGLFFRDDRLCEDCVGTVLPWPAVVHACYRGSRLATGAVVGMLVTHRLLGTWRRCVDAFVALTEWSRDKLVAAGLPGDKVVVKPNFVAPDPGPGSGDGGFALFAGRVSHEKGIGTLIDAWRRVGSTLPLRIAGDGPAAGLLRSGLPEAVRWLGKLEPDALRVQMRAASVLVVPSLWYEAFPRVVVEAFATGLPVVASDLGSLSTLVDHGVNGLRFPPGSAPELAACVLELAGSPDLRRRLRSGARQRFEERFTAARNHEILSGIYEAVQGSRRT